MATATQNEQQTEVVVPTPKWEPLDAATMRFVVDNARSAESPCLCGCGGLTKGRFVPGHDALLKQRLIATQENGTKATKAQATQALATFGW